LDTIKLVGDCRNVVSIYYSNKNDENDCWARV